MNGLSRRKFLKFAGASTCGAALHQVFSPARGMLAFAQPRTGALTAPIQTLIVVNLSGGVSQQISPLYSGAYISANPNVGFTPENSIPLTSAQGLHPALTYFKTLWDANNLAVVNMAGYPNPNRSHDESTRIWFAGKRMIGSGGVEGWGAKLACKINSSMFNGVSLNGFNDLVKGGCNQPRAFSGDLDNFGERGFWGGELTNDWRRYAREEVMALATAPTEAAGIYLSQQADSMRRSVQLIREQTGAALPGPAFPNSGFGQQCESAAKLIAASVLNVRLIYMEIGGFDTHSDERDRHQDIFTDMNAGLAALIDNLAALGRWHNTAIVTMSEFGRTVSENASRGTDHGHGTQVFVMGAQVAGGIKTPTPGDAQVAAALQKDYFDSQVDFRNIFEQVVGAMGVDPSGLFEENFDRTGLGLFI